MKKPALFLDRDGVINVDHGYVHTPENFEFVDGIFEVVAAANQAGYLVVVVTNQAGIGRGYYSEAQFHALTDWMKTKFIENSGQIDAVYFCPYHPEYGVGAYRQESDCRKPAPGMLLQAQRELSIDFGRSIFLGDKLSDMQAGSRAGIEKLFFLNGSADGFKSIRSLREILSFLKIEPMK
jgi:D-glycero-D-manno-heptose 1,7-bisphosphate phosphatase